MYYEFHRAGCSTPDWDNQPARATGDHCLAYQIGVTVNQRLKFVLDFSLKGLFLSCQPGKRRRCIYANLTIFIDCVVDLLSESFRNRQAFS